MSGENPFWKPVDITLLLFSLFAIPWNTATAGDVTWAYDDGTIRIAAFLQVRDESGTLLSYSTTQKALGMTAAQAYVRTWGRDRRAPLIFADAAYLAITIHGLPRGLGEQVKLTAILGMGDQPIESMDLKTSDPMFRGVINTSRETVPIRKVMVFPVVRDLREAIGVTLMIGDSLYVLEPVSEGATP